MPPTMTEDYSFVNNFWDREERGVAVIGTKFTNAKSTFDSLSHFYKERILLEEEYGRKLNSMIKKTSIGATEENKAGLFFESLRLETEQISKSHATQASAISNEVYTPLELFISSFKARKRTIESTILKIIKYKKSLATKLEHLRSKYETECLKFRAMSADRLLLDGNELKKLEVKLSRSENNIKNERQEYYDLYKEAVAIHERFVREWKLALIKYEELEEERIKFLRSNIWTYCNLVSVTCVNVDASCENIRVELEKCEAKKEIEMFTKKYRTGNEVPGLPNFIDYINLASTEHIQTEEPPVTARFNAGNLPSTDSYATVKISKKPPPQEPSEQSNALLMIGRRSEETKKEIKRQLQDENENDPKQILNTPRTELKPPGSEYSDQSTVQNLSYNSSKYPSQNSRYSDSTDMSVHNQSGSSDKHWNSPQRRRRSRGSIQALSDYSSSYEPLYTSKPKTPIFNLQLKQKDDDEDLQIGDSDILKSTLRDLQMGGNGDMNALKKSINPKSMLLTAEQSPKQRNERPRSLLPQPLTTKLQRSERPKSMLLDGNVRATRNERPKSMLLDDHMSHSHVPESPKTVSKLGGMPKFGPLTGRPVLKYCKAIYSYKAKEEDECSFKKRDTILVLEDGDLWWSVEVLGKPEVGQAPSNYLAPL